MKYTKTYFGHGKAPQVYRGGVIEVMADKSLSDAERGQALDVIEELFAETDPDGRAKALQWRAAGADAGDDAGVGVTSKAVMHTGRDMAPLAFADESLKALHEAVVSRQSLQIKAFSTADSLLPAQLAPQVLGPVHETRLMERLPVQAIGAPSWEYVRHVSTTGAAAVVAAGGAKPEIVLVTDRVIATAQKLAAHSATTWEDLSDWSTFAGYVQAELTRQVIDVENAELLSGAGTTGHLTGILATSGILTHDASADTGTNVTALDSVEKSIATLRTGAALAEPDLFVLNPLTWSALRRIKDTQGRFLASPDPTEGAANTLWGVDVLVTTTMAAGAGALIDTGKFGRVLLREGLSLRTGTNNDDFTHNLVRFVCEERLALAVERPAAVLSITGLPTS
jgi:HK97 family phage major capsid protein